MPNRAPATNESKRTAPLVLFRFSRDVADSALVPNGEHPDRVLRYQEAVTCAVTRRAVRNHLLADFVVNAPSHQRVGRENLDR